MRKAFKFGRLKKQTHQMAEKGGGHDCHPPRCRGSRCHSRDGGSPGPGCGLPWPCVYSPPVMFAAERRRGGRSPCSSTCSQGALLGSTPPQSASCPRRCPRTSCNGDNKKEAPFTATSSQTK